MGTVAGRVRLATAALAALALLVPAAGHAATTYGPPYALGPQGGDPPPTNHYFVDPATGEMTILRTQVAGVSGNLGCGGRGPFAYFKVAHEAAGVTQVAAAFTDALIDPYTFVSVAVRQGSSFLNSNAARGPIVGAGTLTVELPSPSTAPIEVWFGIEVSSACPNVDGGTATFSSLTIT